MQRWKLTIEYDGRGFVGWQRQETGRGVQAALEAAIQGFSGETRRVHGAGRTDSGVHARGQVAHFDLVREIGADKLCAALNAHLKGAPAAVLAAEPVAPDFHARFDARARRYRYRIVNRRAPLTFQAGLATHIAAPLDVAAMQDAAARLEGRHDFSSFRAAPCQADSAERTLDRLTVARAGSEEIHIEARARSFLHNQVRIMAGTLIRIGQGRYPPRWIEDLLAARDRRQAGFTAPAAGLYFLDILYCPPPYRAPLIEPPALPSRLPALGLYDMS